MACEITTQRHISRRDILLSLLRFGGTLSIMVIVIANGIGDLSSIPDYVSFHSYTLGKSMYYLFHQLWVISTVYLFNLSFLIMSVVLFGIPRSFFISPISDTVYVRNQILWQWFSHTFGFMMSSQF